MDWQWLILLLFCQILINEVENKEIVAQVNTKRFIQYVPERFLSMTIDPSSLFIAGKLERQAVTMARGLYPSFVRLGGKATNYLKFGKELFVDNSTITEDQWDGVNNFTREAGLDLIVSLNPTNRVQGVWDSRDALQLISYSDKNGYNVAWQLGYDTKGVTAPGDEVGRDIVRLRKILDGFQRYTRNPLFGPDLPDVHSLKEATFIREMLAQAGPVLGAIFIQLPFSTKEDPEPIITNALLNMDRHIWGRELRFGRIIPKKPIWLAEKNPSRGSAEDAVSLVKHLGTAARMGCQIVLRQVGPESLKNPTPDYWLALLYKNLVGRGVFDTKVNSGNNSEIALFTHCSQSLPQDKSILDTGYNYGNGAITVFGVNESPETVKLNLKAGMKDELVHLYTLTFQNDPDRHSEKTFLNEQLLDLSPSGELPIISPKIKRTIKNGINIPPKSIFFIVLPDLKTRMCSSSSSILIPDVQSLSKKLIQVATDVLDKPRRNELRSEEEDKKKVYVKFTKSLTAQNHIPNLEHQTLEDSEPDVQVKYITFNDNSLLRFANLTETTENPKVNEKYDENKDSENDEKYPEVTDSYNVTGTPTTVLESKKRRKRSSNQESIISQEDLVKYLNQYASNVYRTSHSEETDKVIPINSIPQEILNTLRNVKVTFKNLDIDNSPKEIIETVNTNEPSLQENINTPLNGFVTSSNSNIEPIVEGAIDGEIRSTYPELFKNDVFDIYNVQKLINNQRIPKEISEKDLKNLEGSIPQESNNENNINANSLKNSEPSEEIETSSIPASKPQSEPSLEITDKSQDEEMQPGIVPKYTETENEPSQVPASMKANENVGTTEIKPKSESNEDEDLKNIISTLTEKKQLGDEVETSGINQALENMPADLTPIMDNVLESDKNSLFRIVKSIDPAIIPNFVAEQGEEQPHETAEQLTTEKEYNENNDKSDFSPGRSEITNEENVQENGSQINDNAEKESQLIENGVSAEGYEDVNEGEKTSQNENTFEAEKVLTNEQEFPLDSEKVSSANTNEINTENSIDPKSSPLIFSLLNENQQSLEHGPPLPAYDSDTVKVQREIQLGEQIPENIPIVMVPIDLETDLPKESIDETKLENINVNPNTEDSQEVISPHNNLLELANNERDRKDVSNILMDETAPESPLNTAESVSDSIQPLSESQVASFENVPLENTEDKSYGKTHDSINTNQDNLLPNIENTLKEMQPIEPTLNDDPVKGTKLDQSDNISELNPEISPEIALQLSETDTFPSNVPHSFQTQTESEIPQIPGETQGFDKNPLELEDDDEKNIAQYKLHNKIIPEEESDDKKSNLVHKPDIPKVETEIENRQRIATLKRQIMEIREQFRAQVREEGLKTALQHREEEMRKYLNHDKPFKNKFVAYPLTHDHNVLSRPRRLSYYPESDLSEEDPYDYIDTRTYKKRSDSYGMPILDDYDKPYSRFVPTNNWHQQIISGSHTNSERNHILFPLDPKTPQAVVYNDRIIPAKFYGLISVNEEPTLTKSTNVVNKRMIDLPADSVYQKYYSKHYDPQTDTKEKQISKTSEISLPPDTYSLPRDAYIKTIDEPTNYIPIVVLSTPMKNYRKKRSVSADISDIKSPKTDIKDVKKENNLKKRSIDQRTPLDSGAFSERSYDFLNEIPNENENHVNSVEYIHPNDIFMQKNEIGVNKFSKSYPEFLTHNNVPLGYIQSGPNYNSPPIWNKDTHDIEQRHFLHPPIMPPHSPVLVHQGITELHPEEKSSDPTQFYFWSMMHNKFKYMLGMLNSLAQWCSGNK